ncbi:tetratricopeptide repeat protein [Thiocystis violacea]|uniref:tetratricopeptide repeat protein n=1 Tax=Thiocystis violacea TaxID=13725 RepID=UPI001905BE12|nr:hypothetical protein [Thiocystis violacea]MBK1718750.1 hypothetical protein [Thiocystis violacea]
MERSIKFLTTLVTLTGLSACAMGPREGPPAPIVQVTPREAPPTSAPAPVRAPESVPEKKPAKPVKRGTKVYAYQDPNAPPEPKPVAPSVPEPVAPAPPGQASPSETAQQTPARPPVATPGGTPGPQEPRTPPQRPDGQQVAKADPKVQLPATAPPKTGSPAPPPAPPAPPPAPVAPLPPSRVAAPNLPPAADSLATQAEQQRQSGDFTGAAASLERSLRIAPRESYLWNRLARVRMEQGQSAQAGNLAARSNDLAGDKADLKKDNWRIIAESKRRAGDVAGAGEADKRAGSD